MPTNGFVKSVQLTLFGCYFSLVVMQNIWLLW